STAGEGITKAGAGVMRLQDINTYTGNTIINAGTLDVEGSVKSLVAVFNTATLSGHGTVGPLKAESGGTVRPFPIDPTVLTPLLAQGNAVFAPNSTFAVDITATSNGTLKVTGGLSLNQPVQLKLFDQSSSLPPLNTALTILSAGGLSGVFANAANKAVLVS